MRVTQYRKETFMGGTSIHSHKMPAFHTRIRRHQSSIPVISRLVRQVAWETLTARETCVNRTTSTIHATCPTETLVVKSHSGPTQCCASILQIQGCAQPRSMMTSAINPNITNGHTFRNALTRRNHCSIRLSPHLGQIIILHGRSSSGRLRTLFIGRRINHSILVIAV